MCYNRRLMNQLSFWTPISNHQNKLIATADQAFYFGGRQAQLIESSHPGEVKVVDGHLSYLEIAGRVALLFTVITPLFFLLVKGYDRFVSNTYQFLEISSASTETETETSSHEIKPLKDRVVLYMSLTGNPTHLGHMAAVATAIDTLVKNELEIDHVRVSLSDEAYHQSKVSRAKGKKIALAQEDREYLLNGAIQEATKRNMFQGVRTEYWNDQNEGFSDHPDSYKRLVQELKCPVYLVAGADLCNGMNNWPSVQNAVIVSREAPSSDTSKYSDNTPPSYQRLFVKSLFPEFETLSSSAVQEGKARLEPEELQTFFEQRKLALQT